MVRSCLEAGGKPNYSLIETESQIVAMPELTCCISGILIVKNDLEMT